MHLHYLQPGFSMYEDYQVQEFCLIGSQTPAYLRPIPIRYLKEDSSDNTVRTSASNLNFNYCRLTPTETAFSLSNNEVKNFVEMRLQNDVISNSHYQFEYEQYHSDSRQRIPFSVLFETAHFDADIGIVSGKDNRDDVLPMIKLALDTPYDVAAYNDTRERYEENLKQTFDRAAELDWSILEWDKQAQYEAHAQIIFRLKDQYDNDVEHFDITFKSQKESKNQKKLESMLEDKHVNKLNKGTITFYLRLEEFKKNNKNKWKNHLKNIAPMDIEITGYEPLSGDITYLPASVHLDAVQLGNIVEKFKSTVIDVRLLRLPSDKVFEMHRSESH